MLSHVYIGVTDFQRAFSFYSHVMEELSFVLKFSEPANFWAGWMQPSMPRPLVLVGRPYDGKPANPGNGQMIALLAPNRNAVDRCYATAIACGGTDEGGPALRAHYHPDYYGAYFRDPDGNKLCACCHEPVGNL
jgi:catechol 2,3-dioxygenase-like lactoylglutathione lyase family enzyme